jgi:predicted methyltransferase
VLAIARELIEARGLLDRFAFVPGDYRADPLPGGFDAALYCGALHQENERTAPGVFAKLLAALEPGGTLWVVDLMLGPSRAEPAFSALFALNMMLVSPIARVFSGQEVLDLAERAGFREGRLNPLAGSPYWLVTARKPG